MITEVVKKIVPKSGKYSDGNRRRGNLSDRLGSNTDRLRRSKDLGFQNPNSVGLLGNATSSRPTTSVPPLMSSLDLSTAVAAIAALKSNQQPRGALLPSITPTMDISPFSNPPQVLPNLVQQPARPDPAALSALLSNHAPAINRIFNPQETNQHHSFQLSARERRYRSRSSSRESSDRYRRDHHPRQRRRYQDERDEDYYREYRSKRLGRANAHFFEDNSLSMLILTLFASLYPFIVIAVIIVSFTTTTITTTDIVLMTMMMIMMLIIVFVFVNFIGSKSHFCEFARNCCIAYCNTVGAAYHDVGAIISNPNFFLEFSSLSLYLPMTLVLQAVDYYLITPIITTIITIPKDIAWRYHITSYFLLLYIFINNIAIINNIFLLLLLLIIKNGILFIINSNLGERLILLIEDSLTSLHHGSIMAIDNIDLFYPLMI